MRMTHQALKVALAIALGTLTASAATIVLQQGTDGYNGFKDAEIRDPSTNYDNGVYPREWPQRIAIVNTNY